MLCLTLYLKVILACLLLETQIISAVTEFSIIIILLNHYLILGEVWGWIQPTIACVMKFFILTNRLINSHGNSSADPCAMDRSFNQLRIKRIINNILHTLRYQYFLIQLLRSSLNICTNWNMSEGSFFRKHSVTILAFYIRIHLASSNYITVFSRVAK